MILCGEQEEKAKTALPWTGIFSPGGKLFSILLEEDK